MIYNTCFVKNTLGTDATYLGQLIASGSYYQISDSERLSWEKSDAVLSAISGGDLVVAKDGSGSNDISGLSDQLAWLSTATVSVSAQPEPLPFAQPTYRTKRNAVAAPASCAVNASTTIDFQLTSELYVSGGRLIVENVEFGDYITAEVHDVDAVIPEAYRAALCEAWPVVGQYIVKEFIDTSTGSVASHDVNTYPLNAKLSAGLYLRITYHAINSGSARNVAVNYYLTKKL